MAHLIGVWLMDHDPSAINTKGVNKGKMSENLIELKTILCNGVETPIGTGVSMRRNIIDTMKKSRDFKGSKYVKVEGKNVAYSNGNPILSDQDDIMGFFKAKKDEGVYSRKSSLCVSNLVYLRSRKYVDFRVSAQHEGDPVVYEIELVMGNATLKTDLNLGRLGVIYNKNISGYKNMPIDRNDEIIKSLIQNGATLYDDDKVLVLPYEMRKKRVELILRSIVYLQGGANMARDYTDISPVIFVLYVGKYAGQTLYKPYDLHKESNSLILNPHTMYRHYKDNLFDEKTGNGSIISKFYVGWRPGYPFLYPNVERVVSSELIELFGEENIFIGTPNQVITQFMMDFKEDWLKPDLEV